MIRVIYFGFIFLVLLQIASEVTSIRKDMAELKLQATSVFALTGYILPVTRVANNCPRCHHE